jgi:putative restriction endonuclease
MPGLTDDTFAHVHITFYCLPLVPDQIHIRIEGIPEYWIVDPTAQTMQFLRRVDGAYQEQPLAPDGRYWPTHLPWLTCVPARLWAALFHPDYNRAGDCHVFEGVAPAVPITLPRPWKAMHRDEWDATPFAPTIGRQPTRIMLDHYLAWCPEATFEWDDGQIVIGDWRGTRNVLGCC